MTRVMSLQIGFQGETRKPVIIDKVEIRMILPVQLAHPCPQRDLGDLCGLCGRLAPQGDALPASDDPHVTFGDLRLHEINVSAQDISGDSVVRDLGESISHFSVIDQGGIQRNMP